jgi:plasmid stability protein
MPTLTIRNLDEKTHRALRMRAAENGRSVEEEVRRILAEQADVPSLPRNPRSPEEIAEAVKRLQKHAAPMRKNYSVNEFVREKRADAARELADENKPFRR